MTPQQKEETAPMVNPATDQALVLSTRDNWLVLQEEAKMALRSGFLPQHIKTPEQAIAIAMVGRELGISPWRALTGIKVIQGTPTLSSELMAHLIYRAHGGDALTVEETTPERCTISYQRRGAKDRKSYTYTMAMAERAGLASNPNYKKHPENMLRARCISNIARMAFPDTIAGCYTEDEIGGLEDTSTQPTTTVIDSTPEQPRQLHAAPVVDASPEPLSPDMKAVLGDLVAMQSAWREETGEIVTIPKGKSLAVLQAFHARWKARIDEHRAAQQGDPFPDVPNASASIRQPVAAGVLAEDDLPYND